MIRHCRNAAACICASLLFLTALSVTSTLHAGDEDMSPSAYHVFDPETGYMMTVDPLAEEQPDPTPDEAKTETATNDTAVSAVDRAAAPALRQMWGYVVAAIVLIAGIAVWAKSRA
ncbi:MAG: hypothetical protein OEM51_04815 [Gammaproteobacteria bacterium]|nr:hypothetical protein [Gammaproteobacteria bacterium]MDH3430605.1 hypothetical protein [Gammaproteobacteria bacterium]